MCENFRPLAEAKSHAVWKMTVNVQILTDISVINVQILIDIYVINVHILLDIYVINLHIITDISEINVHILTDISVICYLIKRKSGLNKLYQVK